MAECQLDGKEAQPRCRSFGKNLALLAAMLAVAMLPAIGYVYVIQPSRSSTLSGPPVGLPTAGATPFFWPGIRTPPARAAASAGLPGDAQVIGVSAGGRHRAYLVTAFAGTMHHVVNDLLGDQPVSVTHCDLTNCTRVFTDRRRGVPLELSLGGFVKKQMMLCGPGGGTYSPPTAEAINQASPPFPYQAYPHELTTWKKWRAAHPDTDVYTAAPPARPKS